MTTGQIIFREAGTKDGKRIVMAVAILAIPEGAARGEHQYTITGSDDLSMLTVHAAETDLTEELRGCGLSHALKLPVWRI
jgi:hypothetical protein